MSFQLKNFASIVASMINVSRASQTKITDFSVGAVARTLMESPAIEIEELYLQMFLGLQDAIPVAIYQSFGFGIVDALPAGGILVVTFPALIESLTIPKGATFDVPGKSLSFRSIAAVTRPVGATQASIAVACTTARTIGNIQANELTAGDGLSLFPFGYACTNQPFTTGVDAESEIERKTRFASFISSVARGTVDSIRYSAESATVRDSNGVVQEYVTRIGIDEHAGRVNVYVSSSIGTPSKALLTKVQSTIDGYVDPTTGQKVSGYRPAGVSVTALPMLERVVSIGLTVATQYTSQRTDALRAGIVSVVGRTIFGVGPGSALRAEAITSGVLSLNGVMLCDLTGNINLVCGKFERLIPGSISINWITNA